MKIKFLFIRFSSIGDIVLTSPVIRIAKEQIKGAEIHFLTKKQYSTVLENNPYIDKLISVDNQNFNKILSELYNERYDYIIDLHKNIRSYKVRRKLKILSFSFDKLNKQKWLYVNFKINKLPDIHIVDRYLKTLSAFDVKNDNKGLDYFIPENDEINLHKIDLKKNNYIAVVVGAQHYTKQIPVEILQKIISSVNKQFVLLGGRQDENRAKMLSSINKNIINLTGKLNLNQSADVIRKSQLVISSDTGLMHIASAFKKNIVSLWGNTVPEFGMYPYMPGKRSRIFQVENLKCRPCSKIGFRKCPKKHFNCMMLQNTTEIISYINEII
jgi:ADP-heptose:LPS heptosyltransferase